MAALKARDHFDSVQQPAVQYWPQHNSTSTLITTYNKVKTSRFADHKFHDSLELYSINVLVVHILEKDCTENLYTTIFEHAVSELNIFLKAFMFVLNIFDRTFQIKTKLYEKSKAREILVKLMAKNAKKLLIIQKQVVFTSCIW